MSESEPLLQGNNYRYNCTKTEVNVNRKVFFQHDLNNEGGFLSNTESTFKKIKRKLKAQSVNKVVCDVIPILDWLPRYNWKEWFTSDLLSGFTVAIMNIPQGMAYALLGNVPPIYGIYMAFFPIIIYSLLGTSRHVSMGGFAITSLLTGNIVATMVARDGYDNTHVAGTVSLTVGLIFLSLFVLRAGIMADLLSKPLINAFTCASAFHIICSQLKDMFGLTGMTRTSGNFKLIKTIYQIILALPTINYATVIVSAITSFLLLGNHYWLKPFLAKRTKIPFPIELFVVVLGTSSSHFMDLPRNYNVTNVGVIQTGFPEVRIPILNIVPEITYDCFFIALVSYTITMSMALMFASKRQYEVRPNQELFAMGCSDITGAFFGCIPITASLSRSLIQFEVGGKTQLTSLVSCTFLIFVLLYIGSVFEPLPKAILACVIVIALRSMLLQIQEARTFWKLSKWDFGVWLCTFLTTLLVNIDVGLFIGFALSLASLFVRGFKPYTCLLGRVPGTDLFVDTKRYKSVVEMENIKLFRFCGGLNFASKSTFKKDLFTKIDYDPLANETPSFSCLVLDFSSVTFIDPQAVYMLNELSDLFIKINVDLYICGCSAPVYQVIKSTDDFYKKEEDDRIPIFPTVNDAVSYRTSFENDNITMEKTEV